MPSFPPTCDDMAKAVREYLSHGWSVIPVRPNDKKALVEWARYQNEAPTVTDWVGWLTTPGVNVALVTGAVSGVTVVDVDGPTGMASMQGLSDEIPKTLLAKSPHGWHMFFEYQPGLRNKAALMPGVDIRGDGGYVLISPSRLTDGVYEWKRTGRLQPFPSWLAADKIDRKEAQECQTKAAHDDAPRWVTRAMTEGAPSGNRNSTATRLAGYFFGKGLPEDVVMAAMEPYRLACRPELSHDELAAVIRSTARYRRFAAAVGVTEPPTVEATQAGERYMWDDVAFALRGVSRRGTAILAEVAVSLSLPGQPQAVRAPTVLNLVSQRERDGLAQSMARTVPEVAWDARVDAMCRMALESYRRGQPAITLRDAIRPASGGAYALEPLLLADAPTMWFADGGTGKSLLALAAGLALSGHDVFGRLAPLRPRRVLYLDWEWDDWQHADRMRHLLGEDFDVADILYRRCYGTLDDEIESIRQTVADEEIEYVILDSIGPACGGDMKDPDTALRFGRNMRSLQVGSLWITHVTKNGAEDPDKPFGSVYFHNLCRLAWRIKRQSDEGSDVIEVGFYNTKSNATKLHKPLGLRVSFGYDRTTIIPIDLIGNPELARGLSMRDRIMGALRAGPHEPALLADIIGSTEGSVRVKLTKMHKAGEVTSLGDGTWALAERTAVPA